MATLLTSVFEGPISRISDAATYLEVNHSNIFLLTNEPDIIHVNETVDVFSSYYTWIRNASEDELLSNNGKDIKRRIIEEYLPKVYSLNELDKKAYSMFTKLTALFGSVYVQRRLELASKDTATFFPKLQEEVCAIWPEMVARFPGKVEPDFLDYTEGTRHRVLLFFAAVKFGTLFQAHAKWEKLAFYLASMATGFNVWFCPGGAPSQGTLIRWCLFTAWNTTHNSFGSSSGGGAEKRKRAATAAEAVSTLGNDASGGGRGDTKKKKVTAATDGDALKKPSITYLSMLDRPPINDLVGLLPFVSSSTNNHLVFSLS